MDRAKLTMEDLAILVNAFEGEFILLVELERGEDADE